MRNRKGDTQYRPLIDALAVSDQMEIRFTLAEIEQMIGKPISDTAATNGQMWRSPMFGYVRQWHALGWRAKLVRMRDNPHVVFTRDMEE